MDTKLWRPTPLTVTTPVPAPETVIFVPATICVTAVPPLPVIYDLFSSNVPELTVNVLFVPVYVSSTL